MKEIILDTETTGLDPSSGHRIIEIGALEMENKILTGRKFHYYINPLRDVPVEAFRIHGISTEFLKDKPQFHEVADEFLSFIEDSSLVIHNANFDLGFLNSELGLIKKSSLSNFKIIDTLLLARRKFPGQKNNLDALCKRFNIDNSNRQFHGALKDAALLSEVYIELTGGRQIKLEVSTGKTYSFSTQKIEKKLSYDSLNLKVIKATEEEQELHKELMNKINS